MSTIAGIKNKIVTHVVESDYALANTVLKPLFNWDQLIDVTNVVPRPGEGWTYNNGVFSYPVP